MQNITKTWKYNFGTNSYHKCGKWDVCRTRLDTVSSPCHYFTLGQAGIWVSIWERDIGQIIQLKDLKELTGMERGGQQTERG